MSNIDKRALREAAEKALPAMKRLLMMPNDELFDEALLNVDGDVDAANEFNLLTGPETVLALLDELEESERLRLKFQEANCELSQKLEAAEKTSAARLGAIDTTHKMFQRERYRADAAEKRNSELSQKAEIYDMLRVDYGLSGSLVDFVDWQAKRIADLEARDKPKLVQCWSCKHDIAVLAIADCDGYCPRCAAPINLDDEPYAAAGKGEAS